MATSQPLQSAHKIPINISNMKSVIFAAAVASAAAFAPVQTGKATTSLNAFENELGAQPPLGFYDPFGMLDDADQERFDRLRYVEIKHGRISQLAFLGQITTRAGYHLPGAIDGAGDSFADFPNGFAAIGGPDSIPGAGTGQILFFIGALELAVMKDVTGENEFVGDFRNGYIDFGWDNFDEETKLKKRAVELNNGRAAMMGILGLMVHEQLGGSLPIVGDL
ncbi:fucoxanthin-chlorophyll a-c binding protein [Skeletonema marinoi]|uniref:Fucoxanthin-chlorophyll a-c binding protein n=1 Tax=Skeletonema marinoi TaxID=267567 RepID=A0AAD8XT74_9STRA|nr:fucoxanthin-chlorophyll a-c binding protein [Skeletonema marinoi]